MPAVLFNMTFTTHEPAARCSSEQRLAHAQERAYYNWTAPYNYKAYMEDRVKTQEHKDYEDYMSKGDVLFNQRGILSREEVERIKSNISTTKSIIWHGFISFDDVNSKRFQTKQQCIDYLHDVFNVMLDQSHLKRENIELVASLHTDTQHRHIHFTFFEKEPIYIKKGEKTFTRKGKINQKAIDNLIVASNLYLDERRHELHTLRDKLIDKIKAAYPVGKTATSIKDKDVEKEIVSLASSLPADGRLGYNSENMKPLRNQVDKLVNLVISKDPQLMKAYAEWQKELSRKEDFARQAMIDSKFAYVDGRRVDLPEQKELRATAVSNWDNIRVIEDLKKDMRSRLGNYVIRVAKNIKGFSIKQGKPTRVAKAKAKSRRRALKGATMLLNGMFKTQLGRTDFTFELHRAEREIEQERRKNAK